MAEPPGLLMHCRSLTAEQGDLLFTATHKAKGRDYECVEMISEDFMTRQELRQGESINQSALCEEINVGQNTTAFPAQATHPSVLHACDFHKLPIREYNSPKIKQTDPD